MLDMGFADAIKKIIETITKQNDSDKHFQRILLSATPTTGLLNNFLYIIFNVSIFSFESFC